jgi:hypothetical protein
VHPFLGYTRLCSKTAPLQLFFPLDDMLVRPGGAGVGTLKHRRTPSAIILLHQECMSQHGALVRSSPSVVLLTSLARYGVLKTALWPREVLMCMQAIHARADVSHTYMVTSNMDVLWQSLGPCVLLLVAV